jgi:uncharacterized membrane protein YhfC
MTIKFEHSLSVIIMNIVLILIIWLDGLLVFRREVYEVSLTDFFFPRVVFILLSSEIHRFISISFELK